MSSTSYRTHFFKVLFYGLCLVYYINSKNYYKYNMCKEEIQYDGIYDRG